MKGRFVLIRRICSSLSQPPHIQTPGKIPDGREIIRRRREIRWEGVRTSEKP